MTKYSIILLMIVITSCGKTSKNNEFTREGNLLNDSTKGIQATVVSDSAEDAYATYFVAIVDTNRDYWTLHKKMTIVNHNFEIPIDTLGRYYNIKKNLIALPDDADDEMYAGEYFQRRFPSVSLSLEYLNEYMNTMDEKMIALVSGIYETQDSADHAVQTLKQLEPTAFVIKAKMYVGCMH